MDDYEEKKINHERKRREELKKLETDKASEKKQIETDYKLKLELVKRSKDDISSADLVARRKAELQIEKDKRLRDLREEERKKKQKDDKSKEDKFQRKSEDFKREEEIRHKRETEHVKQLYVQKLELERDKIREENNRLLEESGDIDFQVRQFKADLMENQVSEAKYKEEKEMKQQI